MINNTSIYVSAAGKGTRMKSLTTNTPKPLLDICGKPIISYLLDYISSQLGSLFNDCIVSYGYLPEKWDSVICKYSNISFFCCDNTLPVVSQFLSIAIKFSGDNIVAISGDIFCDPTIISDLIEAHNNSCADATIAVNRHSHTNWKSWEYITNNGHLLDIRRNTNPNYTERYCIIVSVESIRKYTCDFSCNMGLLAEEFNPYLQYNKGWTYLIKKMIDNNFIVNIFESDKYLFNINTPENLQQAMSIATQIH